jgi:hypothetical protein
MLFTSFNSLVKLLLVPAFLVLGNREAVPVFLVQLPVLFLEVFRLEVGLALELVIGCGSELVGP